MVLTGRAVVQLGMICYVSCRDRYSPGRGRPDVVGPSRPLQASTSIPSSSSSLLYLSSSSSSSSTSSSTLLTTSRTGSFSDHHRQFPAQRSTALSSLSSAADSVDNVANLDKTVNGRELASSYHLVWNQGFGQQFLLTTIGLATIHGLVLSNSGMATTTTTTTMMTKFFSGYMSSMGLSLLASSCCLIQIIANMLVGTVGCLGLNTSLGPSRPYFLALLFYLTVTTKSVTMKPTKLMLRLGIAFLPEIVHFWNSRDRRKFFQNLTTLSKPSNDGNININTSTNGMVATLHMDVPAMGCVACINKIDRTIQNQIYELNLNQKKICTEMKGLTDSEYGDVVANYNHITNNDNSTGNTNTVVVDVSSWLDPQRPKGGSSKVVLPVQSKEEAERIGQTLIESLDDVGFGGSTISKLEIS